MHCGKLQKQRISPEKKSFINVCCDEDGTLNLDIGEGEGEGNIEPADVTNRFITCQR